MVTTAERGRQVRRRLVQAATEIIVERGWTAATTRIVAERAGVAPGLVHYHFPSVQALLGEAALSTARALTAGLSPLLAGARTAGEALTALLGALDSATGADPASVLLIEAYLQSTRDAELRRRLGEVIAEFRADLAGHLAAHDVPDPATTAAVLAAAVDGVLLHRSVLGPPGGDVPAVLRRLLVDR